MSNEHLIALKLMLDELGFPSDGTATETEMQWAMYLAQQSGVNLGYNFGWYHSFTAAARHESLDV